MNKFINIWVRATAFIVILMVAVTGWKNLSNHFSIYDDIGVVDTIFNSGEANSFRGKLLEGALCAISGNSIDSCPYSSISQKLFVVPSYWTYAPFQFYWTAILLNHAENLPYEKIKFLGRLPSYIFGWVGIGLLYFLVFRKLFRSDLVAIICAAFLASSLELRIFEAQMMSYSIGMLSNAIIIFAILYLAALDMSNKIVIMVAILIGIAISMQYQGLLLFAAGLMGILIYSRPLKLKKFILLLTITLVTVFIICGNIFAKSNRAISWNSGPNNEYITLGNYGLERISSFLLLVYENISYNIYYVSTPVLLQSQYINVYSYCVVSLIVIGIIFNNRKGLKFPALFLGLYLGIYFFLVFLGKLAFSPSRHSLYLLPVIVALMGSGLDWLQQVNRKIFNLFLFFISLFLVTSAHYSIDFFERRADPVKEHELVALVNANNPQFIIYDSRNNEIKYISGIKKYPFLRYSQNAEKITNCPLVSNIRFPGTLLFYSSSRSIDERDVSNYIEQVIPACDVGRSIKDKFLVKNDGVIFESIGSSPLELTNKLDSTKNSLYISRFKIQTTQN